MSLPDTVVETVEKLSTSTRMQRNRCVSISMHHMSAAACPAGRHVLQPEHVQQLKEKLLPLSDVFPADGSSDALTGSAGGRVTLRKQEQGQQRPQQEGVEMKSQHAQQQRQQAETQQPGTGRQEQWRLECNHELLRAVSPAEGSSSTKQQRQQKGGWCCFAGRADI